MKAGTTPAAVSFPKVQREQAERSRVTTEGPRSGLEHPAHPTIGASHPCGRTAAPSQGPLGSAAKVNNECIALIVKPIIHVAFASFLSSVSRTISVDKNGARSTPERGGAGNNIVREQQWHFSL